MDKRYKLMSAFGVRNLAGFNQKLKEAAIKDKPLTIRLALTLRSQRFLRSFL